MRPEHGKMEYALMEEEKMDEIESLEHVTAMNSPTTLFQPFNHTSDQIFPSHSSVIFEPNSASNSYIHHADSSDLINTSSENPTPHAGFHPQFDLPRYPEAPASASFISQWNLPMSRDMDPMSYGAPAELFTAINQVPLATTPLPLNPHTARQRNSSESLSEVLESSDSTDSYQPKKPTLTAKPAVPTMATRQTRAKKQNRENQHSTSEEKDEHENTGKAGTSSIAAVTMTEHKERKKTIYKCDTCAYKCPRKSNMVQHLRTHDLNKETFSCRECPRTFSRMKDLQRHGSVHDEQSRYRCTECGLSYKRKDGLQRHEQNKHSGKKKG